MTFEASSEIVLQMTAPHPSSNALPMTFAFVPGGPEPMTNGLGSCRLLTVVSRVDIVYSQPNSFISHESAESIVPRLHSRASVRFVGNLSSLTLSLNDISTP